MKKEIEKKFLEEFGCLCAGSPPDHTASSCRGAFDTKQLCDWIDKYFVAKEDKK